MGTSMIQWLPLNTAYNGSECLTNLMADSSLNQALKYILAREFLTTFELSLAQATPH